MRKPAVAALRVVSLFVFVLFAAAIPGFAIEPEDAAMTSRIPPLDPADLAMKSDPKFPGVHALVLYREALHNDQDRWEKEFFRVKIFDEEGKKHANVELAYQKSFYTKDSPFSFFHHLGSVKGRTIHPDGSIVEFDGKVYDKTIKRRGEDFKVKSFTLPDVQPGSIIEYSYQWSWDEFLLISTRWDLQSEIPTRKVHVGIRAFSGSKYNGGMEGFTFNYRWAGLPAGIAPTRNEYKVELTLENVPALLDEDFMPPPSERMSVGSYYTHEGPSSPQEFWNKRKKKLTGAVDGFVKPKSVEAEVRALIAGADSPDAKLRKLYARAQQIRNVTFERPKSAQEIKALEKNDNTGDVLKHGYGSSDDINRLFAAMARAAGVSADVFRLSARDDHFFKPDVRDEDQLDSEVVVVSVEGTDQYFDPGTPFCPFGTLFWAKTQVPGLRLGKDNASFVNTPTPDASQSVLSRKAKFALDKNGTLKGTAVISFGGQYGIGQRIKGLQEDDQARKERLESEVAAWLPKTATVELKNVNSWTDGTQPLVAEFAIAVPNAASPTGRRLFLPATIFRSGKAAVFRYSARSSPVYFPYPFTEQDELTITPPAGYEVETLAPAYSIAKNYADMEIAQSKDGNTLQFQRKLTMKYYLFKPEHFEVVKGFFDSAQEAEQRTAVLRSNEVAQQ